MRKILINLLESRHDYISIFEKLDINRLTESVKNIKNAYCPNHLTLIEDNKVKLDQIA